MHQLYMHYLGCKSNWNRCSLVVSVSKQMSREERLRYEWWTYERMCTELGKDLADDLVRRHKEEESRLPPDRKGQYIRVML